MSRKNETSKLRVLFNDSHANISPDKLVAQGGPSIFAEKFLDYAKQKKSWVEPISLLFSHNEENRNFYIRTTKKDREIYELVYPREILLKSYGKKFTKKNFIEFLESPLKKVDEIFKQSNPDIVFLNGFSLSNWIILETAHINKVPVCIQHAGIWKKEILISQNHFSSSIRRIFSSMEKDIINKASHQIFLNEFSRDIFFKIHNTQKTKKLLSKTSIIPLPANEQTIKTVGIKNKGHYSVGMVARWDNIKNHGAIIRLATYISKKRLPISLSVVTRWPEKLVSKFKNKYEKKVRIIPPMSQARLRKFYASQDLCIIPSRFDVSPTVLMEAILCGKPVIISDSVGWVSYYKKLSLNDLIISPRASGEKIYKTISKLISNKNKYMPKFILLQKKIAEEHQAKLIFNKYYKIFKNI